MIGIPPIVERIRDIARVHGWCICVHGTMVRDYDLVAVPWIAEAVGEDELVKHIADGIGYTSHGHSLGARRPGGRRSILLMHPDAVYTKTEKGTWNPPCIDLSVVPLQQMCEPTND